MGSESLAGRLIRRLFALVLNAAQWVVFAFMAFVLFAVLLDVRKLSAPGAPVLLFYSAVATALLMVIVHLPLVFRRLPRWTKWAAYVAVLPAMVVMGISAAQMEAAWAHSPAAAQEAAARAALEREAAASRAKAALEREAAASQAQEARDRAAQAQVEAETAERKASFEAELQSRCERLVPSVRSLSKRDFGPEVIEINDIVPSFAGSDSKTLSCIGTAVVSRGGDRAIDFGTQTTPQGKVLVTMQLR